MNEKNKAVLLAKETALDPNIDIVSNKNYSIDKKEAQHFLSILSESEPVTFQTFDDNSERKDPSLIKVLNGTLEEHFDVLKTLNQNGAGVFVTINKTDLRGRKKENILQVRSVFIDLDGVPLGPIYEAPIEPHLIIESSPGRYHVYWLVEGVALDIFSMVQEFLISKYNSDASVKDLSRVMRLPGFLHKKGSPFMTKILQSSLHKSYKANDFLKVFSINLSDVKSKKLKSIKKDYFLNALIEKKCI